MAAVIFCRALVLDSQALRPYGARIVLPNHDAMLIEAPLGCLQGASDAAKQAMQSAFTEFFPRLTPRVEVENKDVSCWNKDGRADSFDRFLDDPDFRL